MPNPHTTVDERRAARARAARPLRLYVAGQALVLVGAWSIQVSGSMLPMALASAAALMLTLPLVSHLYRAGRERRARC